jgi:competence protein ComEC
LHYSNVGGAAHNAAEKYIANPSVDHDKGYWIEVLAHTDGSFTVLNDRNHFEKSYRK